MDSDRIKQNHFLQISFFTIRRGVQLFRFIRSLSVGLEACWSMCSEVVKTTWAVASRIVSARRARPQTDTVRRASASDVHRGAATAAAAAADRLPSV